MKLEMRTRGIPLTQQLKDHIEKRFRLALARFDGRLRRVHVLVEDVNGPRGGEDIQCRIRAELPHTKDLVINEVHSDPFAAVARASTRISRVLSRRLEHLNARRRGRGRGRAK
jgi:putative sigma-54 modulation protein